jgi:hypothetical protein
MKRQRPSESPLRPRGATKLRSDPSREAAADSLATKIAPELSGRVLEEKSSLSSRGRSLTSDVRGRLETRFKFDFGRVRVFDDPNATSIARGLDAHAVTAGTNVFLGRRAMPQDASTRKMIAHELAHVAHNRGQPGRVDRMALSPDQYKKSHTSGDWIFDDITNWRRDLSFKIPNTFIDAAAYNTKAVHPDEYKTIFERSEYYFLTNVLTQRAGGATGNVRFFRAAGIVTSADGVGAIEAPAGWALHSAESIQILNDVNKILFAANMRIINKLENVRKEPTDPRPGGTEDKIEAMNFDLDMVETEQGIVEGYLAAHKATMSAEAIKDINDDLNFKGFWRTMGEHTYLDTLTFDWAKKALGVDTLDFLTLAHRVAIGKALVFHLHGASQAEYIAYMQKHTAPVEHLPQPPAAGSP